MASKCANTLSSLCRTCMSAVSNSGINKQIISEVPIGSKDDGATIMEILQIVQPQIKVKMKDNLPKLICLDCVKKLQMTHAFLELYKDADRKFHKMLKEVEVIDEEAYYMKLFNETLETIGDYDSDEVVWNDDDGDESNEITVFEKEIEKINNKVFREDANCDNAIDCTEFEDSSVSDDNEELLEFEYPYSDSSDIEMNPKNISNNYKRKGSKNGEKSEGILIPSKNADDSLMSQECNAEDNIETTSDDNSNENLKQKSSENHEGIEENLIPTKNTDVTSTSQECNVANNIETTSEETTLKQSSSKNHNEIEDSQPASENSDGSLTCQKCNTVLENIALWKEHMRQHRFVDEERKKFIKKRNSLKKRFKCERCEKAFGTTFELDNHTRVHTGEKPFLCTICGKCYKAPSTLRTHMLRHEGETKYHCLHCPKKFVCATDLYGHMAVHRKDKPFVCDTCGKSFHFKCQLRTHNLYHNKIKNYKCEYCDMSFVLADRLRRHMRTHTGEKPYKCKYCERAFAQSNDLIKHLRSHLGDSVYQCKMCPLGFPLDRDLRVHFATHKDDDEETRTRNLEALKEAEKKLNLKFGLKEV